MRIVVHIGVEKTGSTTIQEFCSRNQSALRAHGILYPRGLGQFNHVALPAVLGRFEHTQDIRLQAGWRPNDDFHKFCSDVRQRLLSAARRERPRVLLLSSEHLSSRSGGPTAVADLKAILQEISEDIQIVVYIRRQDDLLLSLYSTYVKSGGTGDLNHVAAMAWWFDFDRLLRAWEEVFGQQSITVRRFPPPEGKLLDGFFEAAGIPRVAEAQGETRANRSLDHKNTQLLAAINRRLPAIVDGRLDPRRNGLVAFLQERSTGPRLTMSAEERRAFLGNYAAGNERVRERYFPDSASLFPPPEGQDEVPPEITLEDVIDLVGDMWRSRAAEQPMRRRWRTPPAFFTGVTRAIRRRLS